MSYRQNADAVMRSSLGQRALAEGVGYDFWLYAYRDGKSDFKDSDITRYKLAHAESINLLTHYPDKKGAMYGYLESIFNKMQAKKYELAQRYGVAA